MPSTSQLPSPGTPAVPSGSAPSWPPIPIAPTAHTVIQSPPAVEPRVPVEPRLPLDSAGSGVVPAAAPVTFPVEEAPRSDDAQHEIYISPEIAAASGLSMGATTRELNDRLFPRQTDDDSSSVPSVVGLKLGDFQILDRVGIGGMGAVFLARDERLLRDVALKILSPTIARDSASVKRFEVEARSAARLDHEHIARVYSSGEAHGLYFIAYEFVDGTNLRELIQKRGRLEIGRAIQLTIQLALAIRHSSNAGVIHRDIKPSNIIVNRRGDAKLVDLGLARSDLTSDGVELTVAGTTLGTFDYISPEQAKDPRAVDLRSDLYSLGCTFYHMLTGEPPYPEGTMLQKLLDHQSKDSPDPSRKNRRVTPALAKVVKKMMASDLRERYQTAEELIRDLLLVARTGGWQVAAAGEAWGTMRQAPNASSFVDRNLGWLITTSALLVLVLAMQLIPTLSGRSDPPGSGAINARDQGEQAVLPINPPAVASNAAPPSDPALPSTTNEVPSLTSDRTSRPSVPEKTGPGRTDAGRRGEGRVTTAAPSQTANPQPTTSGTGGAAVTPPITPAPTAVSSSASDAAPFVIAGGKAYQSLEAACAEAKDGSIIELRYQGRRKDRERPIHIANKRLVIRAAPGYRPVVEFAPTEMPMDTSQSRMISVIGGALEVVGIDLVLQIRASSLAEYWTLFALDRPEKLKLDRVTITITNPPPTPRQQSCVISQIDSPTSVLVAMGKMNTGSPAAYPEIAITQSVIRGVGDLFLMRDKLPARVVVDDSLIMLDENLLNVSSYLDSAADWLRLEMNHVTCLLGGSLVLIHGGEDAADHAFPVQVTARNNVFASGDLRALIEIRGLADVLQLQKQFDWKGDRNFFDGIKEFRKITTRELLGAPNQPLNYSTWRSYWAGADVGSDRANDAIPWEHRWRDHSFVEATIQAAEFSRESDHPARRGATDATDAGAHLSLLPPLP